MESPGALSHSLAEDRIRDFVHRPGNIFEGLPDSEIEFVAARMHVRAVEPGYVVVAQGSAPSTLSIVFTGALDVHLRQSAGTTVHLSRILPGECVGEMSLLSGLAASADVLAVGTAQLGVLEREAFVDVMVTCPMFARNVGVILSRRVNRANRQVVPRIARLMRLRSHRATPPGLVEAVAESLAHHLNQSLVVIDRREGGAWRANQRISSLDQLMAAETVECLQQPSTPCVLAFCSEDASDALHIEPLLAEYIRYMLVVENAEAGDDGAVSFASQVAADVTLWPDTERPVRGNPMDVCLLVASSTLNAPRSLERAQQYVGARVVRLLAPGAADEGEQIAWLARHLAGLKVGLTLGAGGAMGFAHLGVLRRLREAGVPIDVLTGCSIGAIVAAGVACNIPGEHLPDVLVAGTKQALKLTVPRQSILSNRGVSQVFKSFVGDTRIEDLPLPFAVVAVDLLKRREVVLDRGILRHAVLASMSIPGIFPPVWIGEHCLVDGGVLDPVPGEVARTLGADVVLAVSLVSVPIAPVFHADAGEPARRTQALNFVDAWQRTFNVMATEIGSRAGGDINVVARCETYGLREMERARGLAAVGEAALEDVWLEVVRRLPWLRARS